MRTENGIKYGDTIENMDFPYLEKITKLNVAALASIASAPPPPVVSVEGAVSTDTTFVIRGVAADTLYVLRKRRTDANQWEPSSGSTACKVDGMNDPQPANWVHTCVVKGVRVDDWVFGAASISKDGFELSLIHI